ncbi:hypothetical protein [Streptomyces sp. NPDC004014]
MPTPIAEGKSDWAIAGELVVFEAAVGEHIGNVLTELDLTVTDTTRRRVLAVPTCLQA